MKKILSLFFFFALTHLGTAQAGAIAAKIHEQAKKIDKNLYRDASISYTPGEAFINLSLVKGRDGYDSDSIRICSTAEKCADDDWSLAGGRDYFNTPTYSDVNEFKSEGNNIYLALNLCQISNRKGEVSMAGQCVTITGGSNKKYIYTSYLGRASKCRPDSQCWHKLIKQRELFISKFLKLFGKELFE